uniref:THAP-type domain-containing protein n=1 Tax=Gadus morhua TaxID=8049 RepID=A0A8C5BMA9_GADMO
MVVQCAFRNCTNKPNRWSTQSFHQFPTRDPERTKLWLVAGGLDIKTPAETARNWKICSDHFRPDDFEKPSNLKSKASLKSNAVPSVFSDAPTATGEQEKTVAEDDNPLDLSMSSIEASPSHPVDSSFVPLFSTSSSSSSDIPDILSAAGTKHWSEKKWIVNESKLMQLFTTCQQCGVLIGEEDKKVTTSGTRIHIKWSCMKGHSGEWESCSQLQATSSPAMETLGFRRGLDRLLQAGVRVDVITTDRSPSIRKLMRETYSDIQHQFDPWHVAKGKLFTKCNHSLLKPPPPPLLSHPYRHCPFIS